MQMWYLAADRQGRLSIGLAEGETDRILSYGLE